LTPNDPYMGRTATLKSKSCILYIYSTNTGTEYFKHALYSPFFLSSKCSLFHNANLFGSCIIHILYTGCAKIKKNNSCAKRLIVQDLHLWWKSKTLACFKDCLVTPGLYLVLNVSHISMQYYFKIRLITLLHSVPCLGCHLGTLSFVGGKVASKTDQ